MKLLGFEDLKAKPGARVDTSGILGRYEPKTKTLTIVAPKPGDYSFAGEQAEGILRARHTAGT